ncbi:MAG: type I restriction enzyme HsdR N-terminal domain-containing protein [Thermoleophilia bacterium]
MIKIPRKVSERMSKTVPRFQKVLADAESRDVSESDTVTIITDILSEVFGFDKYAEVTSEQAIRGTFCDLAVKIDGNIEYLLEAKAIGIDLKDNHLRQAVGYGVNHGVEWVVLSNGIVWEIYRIRFEQPVNYDLVCKFNFLEINPKKQDDQGKLFLLCKEGLDKAAIELFHEHVQSVNKYVIAAIVQSEAVAKIVRRELRKVTPGLKVAEEEIEKIIINQVLKREVMEGDEAKQAIKQHKKASVAKPKKKKTVALDEKEEEPIAPSIDAPYNPPVVSGNEPGEGYEPLP